MRSRVPYRLRAASTALLICLFVPMLAPATVSAATNVEPTVNILSAAMRPASTYMDVTYRIDDPDDATVMVRALAFEDGVRSFSNVLRVVTLVENTATNIGDAIPTGVTNTLTWDVASDWDIDLGEVKFEVLCRDSRGLLPFDWVTIPAAGSQPEITISKDAPSDSDVLDALFWLYADGDAWLELADGKLSATAGSGIFAGEVLVDGDTLQLFHAPTMFVLKRMDIARASHAEIRGAVLAREFATNSVVAYAANRPWDENALGADATAATSEVINARWVKHTYTNGAATMCDRFSGLMWVYDAATNGVMNWYAATNLCENLVYAGYDDWFLADRWRLYDVYLQQSLFTNVVGDGYWSSTRNLPTTVYRVIMNTGYVGGSAEWNTEWVWPCRLGQ